MTGETNDDAGGAAIPHLTTTFPAWLATATTGKAVIVHTGPNTASAPADLRADIARARDRGLITTAQKPLPPHAGFARLWQLIVIRLSAASRRPLPPVARTRTAASERRAQIAQLQRDGMDKREMADRLGLSVNTVSDHLRALAEEGWSA